MALETVVDDFHAEIEHLTEFTRQRLQNGCMTELIKSPHAKARGVVQLSPFFEERTACALKCPLGFNDRCRAFLGSHVSTKVYRGAGQSIFRKRPRACHQSSSRLNENFLYPNLRTNALGLGRLSKELPTTARTAKNARALTSSS